MQLETRLTEPLQSEVRAPLAFYPCSVDAKSRLKVPAEYLRAMNSLGTEFFLTSFDGLDINIYTRDGFLAQCAFLEEQAQIENLQEMAESMLFTAKDLGCDVSPDTDGRLHLPPVLRQELNMNELPASCHIGKDRDHFVVMTAERYLAMRAKSRINLVDASKKMRQLGMR